MARPNVPILSRALIARTVLDPVRKHVDFTVTALATALGVTPGSLYHHVAGGRAEIVDLMRAEIYSGIDL